METCKAIVQEGKRRGERCQFPPNENTLYCGRHVRNKEYDEGVEKGIKWCRLFFRGCNSQISESESSCKSCKEKLCKKTLSCSHEGCLFKIKEGKFCKKHERDTYRLEEVEKGIRFCDIERGCFTIVTDSKTCKECLERNRITDNKRYKKKKELVVAQQNSRSSVRTCIGCTKEFEPFQTRYLRESLNCKVCLEKQKDQDDKRERERNYKEEHMRNLEFHYKSNITNSLKRGYGDFQLNFEEFTSLVKNPCYYCKYKKEGETNGIDRVNNDLGYTKENCVTACWKCNRMKHFYHPEFFLSKCKIITKEIIPDKQFYKKWELYYTRSNYRNYTNYKKHAEEERKLTFELSQSQWDWLTRSVCYLCSYQDAHGIGIDRIDNTLRNYTFENCRPCCGSCNNMKNELNISEFIEQCKLISEAWVIGSFSSIPISKNPLKDAESKGHIMDSSLRKHWKADGLYYAILSNTAEPFLESNKEIFTEKEFKELCETAKLSQKDKAIENLKKLLVKLKKRRVRLV